MMADRGRSSRLFLTSAALLGALMLFALLCFFTVQSADRSVRDTYAGVVAAVSARYPAAQADVVREIQSADPSGAAEGYRILEMYGMQNMNVAQTGISRSILHFLLPWGLLFTLAVCAGFTGIQIIQLRAENRRLAGLTDYLRRVDAGDYPMDIRDNAEGSYSILKNELYKITVRLREQAEALKKDKKNLMSSLADISHQIKTPLTSLLVLADLLAGDPPPEARAKFVEKIRLQLERIRWLVSSLLKLSRLDAGAVEFRQERVLMRELIRRAADGLKIPCEIKNLRFTINGDENAGFTGDINWSAEAVANVLKNCMEHTPEGGSVSVGFSENALFSEIVITDSGEGIAREDLPHIFTRFYRGKNAEENSVGIGLAMAKAICRAQYGDITASSRVGEGARFSMKFYKGVL